MATIKIKINDGFTKGMAELGYSSENAVDYLVDLCIHPLRNELSRIINESELFKNEKSEIEGE